VFSPSSKRTMAWGEGQPRPESRLADVVLEPWGQSSAVWRDHRTEVQQKVNAERIRTWAARRSMRNWSRWLGPLPVEECEARYGAPSSALVTLLRRRHEGQARSPQAPTEDQDQARGRLIRHCDINVPNKDPSRYNSSSAIRSSDNFLCRQDAHGDAGMGLYPSVRL
jgi:hypothetical protein